MDEKDKDLDPAKDIRDIKKSMTLERDLTGVYVIVVVCHEDYNFNHTIEIPATIGTPLTYEAHDLVRDSFHVEGLGFHEIGQIPVNYRLTIDDIPWVVDIPLPISVIKRYMSEEQKMLFDSWKANYKGTDYYFEYLQILGAY